MLRQMLRDDVPDDELMKVATKMVWAYQYLLSAERVLGLRPLDDDDQDR
jgi:hypothetical protein